MNDRQNPSVPNIFRDEEGAVMIEFLIVAPFLFTIIFGVFFYTDLNRFTASAQEHAYIQTWKTVAEGRTNLSPSDRINFQDVEAYGIGIPNQLLGFADLRLAMMTYPPIQGGDFRAAALYTINNIDDIGNSPLAPPYEIQSMPVNTFDKREFSTLEVGSSQVGTTYRNSTYLTPLMGAANSFIGKRDEGDAWINITDVTIPARHSIMNDPYSVYWQNGSKRLRYVDRFTIIRDPVYAIAAIVQTIISGKIGIISEIPTVTEDLGYQSVSDALSWLDNGFFELIGDFFDLFLREQAEPLRKVDKRMDENHDKNGKADWGEKKIRNELKLQQNNGQRWEAIQ